MNQTARASWLAAAVVAALLLPLALSDYKLRVMVLALISAIAVIGLVVAFGWAGLIQLGQAAFIGLGAYTSAILAQRFGLSFWITMPLALVLAALVALLIARPMLRLRGHYLALAALVALLMARPMLRLRGHYLALATVGLNVTAEIVAKNWIAMTGGYDGISGIPGLALFGREIEGDLAWYYVALACVLIVAALTGWLRQSHIGRAMIAVRDDEIAAGTSSVAVVRTKVLAFVIASVLAALSGALYAHYAKYIAPQDFDLARSVAILVMLIAGGEMSIVGAIVGAVLLSFLPEWLRFAGDAYLAVFGVGVLLLLILLPDGIAGRFNKWLRRLYKRAPAASHG